MPTLKDYDNPDSLYNPSEQAAREQGQFEDYGKDPEPTDGSDTSRNINNARNREATDTGTKDQFGYGNGGSSSSKASSSSNKKSFFAKIGGRKAASGGIIGAILALVGGLTFFITPGLAIVQMKEILVDDLNDQLGAMDVRTTHVFRAKLNDFGTTGCTIKVRCQYKGMSDKQVKRFEAAGFDVETNRKTAFGRNKVTSLSITDSNGNRIVMDNPSQINKMLGDRVVRKALKKAFNPKFAGFFDATWDGVKQRLKISSKNKIAGDTDEERARSVDDNTQGEDNKSMSADQRTTPGEDATEADRNASQTASADADAQVDAVNSGGQSTDSMFGKVAKSGLKGVAKGLLITGSIDVACTVKNTAEAVEAASKAARMYETAQYASVYLSLADQVKAGDEVDPDDMDWAMRNLNTTDTRQMVVNETSTGTDTIGSVEQVKNPDYGKNAFDSNGYKIAMYNEAPTLSARDMQFTTGGALMGTLSKVNDIVDTDIGDKTCGVVQNNFFRAGSLVVGIAVGAISLGASTAFSIGASVAISMALPLLENYLAQIVAGKVTGGDTKGVDSGNAIFSGATGMMGTVAAARGMKPASSEDLESYMALNQRVESEYIAMETEDAQKTPFDVYNQYSFTGSLARTLLPLQTTSSISLGNSFTNNLGSILNIANSSTTRSAFADDSYNPERFQKCKDIGYEKLGIDADVFCNVRYVMSEEELGMDSEAVVAWMNGDNPSSTKYVSDEAEPNDEFAEWIENCTQRTVGWGVSPEEKGSDGSECREENNESDFSAEELKHFRVYTMDQTVAEAMDYEQPAANTGLTSGGSEFRIASFNILGANHTPTFEARMDRSIGVINDKAIDVVGMQEFTSVQQNYYLSKQSGFDIYPKANSKNPSPNAIVWNTAKFSFVEGGNMPDLDYFGKKDLSAPWVILKDIETEQELYVLNTHDPAHPENIQKRYTNAKQHAVFINSIKDRGIPIFFTGDFNGRSVVSTTGNETYQGKPENLAYCILKKDAGMSNAFDVANNVAFKCPNDNGNKAVDHIYVSPEVLVEKYDLSPAGKDKNGSDVHDTHIADVVIPGIESTGAGTEFIVGTYNQKEGLGDAQHKGAARNMIETEMDIIGTQETGPNKFARYNEVFGDKYGSYPEKGKPRSAGGNETCSAQQAIFYKKSKFKLVKGDRVSVPRYPDAPFDCGGGEVTTASHKGDPDIPSTWANMPIAWLQDVETGQTVIVMNIHNVANVKQATGSSPAKSRWMASKIYVEKIKELQSGNPGVPIVFTGDFNEGTGVRNDRNKTWQSKESNLLFCMFAANGLMKSAAGPPMKCNNNGSGGVDYIYITPQVKVEWVKEIADGGDNSGAPSYSDHPVRYARLVVPGTGGSNAQTGDVGWPMSKTFYDKNKSDWLDPHGGAGTFTGNGTNGVAVDIGIKEGTPVFAMVNGEVVKKPLGRSSRICVGSPNGNDNGGLMIRSKVDGGTLDIAYAHGYNVTAKKTVSAGEKIMLLGQVGNSCGPHLHLDMSYNDKNICPQDVFLALEKGGSVDWASLVGKASGGCSRL